MQKGAGNDGGGGARSLSHGLEPPDPFRQACGERVKNDTTGEAHCTGQVRVNRAALLSAWGEVT